MTPATPDQADTWAALRCHSFQTLTLADQLVVKGVGGWSPRVPQRRRLPRHRKTVVQLVPLLPSFVFVPFERIEAALDLGTSGEVPTSRAFTFLGHRPALPTEQLLGLRAIEARRSTDRQGLAAYRPGTLVRLLYGPLMGHAARVIARKGRDHWVVELAGVRQRILVPSFLLQLV
jgi:hypothetical protein